MQHVLTSTAKNIDVKQNDAALPWMIFSPHILSAMHTGFQIAR